FAGKSLIVFGDFNQLRPVGDDWVFEEIANNVNLLGGNPFWEPFRFSELTDIMRQRNDLPFAQALNDLATHNQLAAESRDLFVSRQVPTRDAMQAIPREALHLF